MSHLGRVAPVEVDGLRCNEPAVIRCEEEREVRRIFRFTCAVQQLAHVEVRFDGMNFSHVRNENLTGANAIDPDVQVSPLAAMYRVKASIPPLAAA